MSLGQDLAPHLPFLRRYGRALTGSQQHGDAYVRATLQAIVAAPGDFPRDVDVRLGLYRTFQRIWQSTNDDGRSDADPSDTSNVADQRLARITPRSRQALLLTQLEAELAVPVIFITAFPERLLTGERPEPTFLITKPFQRATVKAAIAQALFFDMSTVPA